MATDERRGCVVPPLRRRCLGLVSWFTTLLAAAPRRSSECGTHKTVKDLGLQVKVLETFKVVPSWLGSGLGNVRVDLQGYLAHWLAPRQVVMQLVWNILMKDILGWFNHGGD